MPLIDRAARPGAVPAGTRLCVAGVAAFGVATASIGCKDGRWWAKPQRARVSGRGAFEKGAASRACAKQGGSPDHADGQRWAGIGSYDPDAAHGSR
ncbi:MAG: hypothetical protein WAW52_12275 [Methanothrix sp.]